MTKDGMADFTASVRDKIAEKYFDIPTVLDDIRKAAGKGYSHKQIEQEEPVNLTATHYAKTLIQTLKEKGFTAEFKTVHRPDKQQHGGFKDIEYKELFIKWDKWDMGETITSHGLHNVGSGDYLE